MLTYYDFAVAVRVTTPVKMADLVDAKQKQNQNPNIYHIRTQLEDQGFGMNQPKSRSKSKETSVRAVPRRCSANLSWNAFSRKKCRILLSPRCAYVTVI